LKQAIKKKGSPETKDSSLDINDDEFDMLEVEETEWYQEEDVCISSDGEEEAFTNFKVPDVKNFKSFTDSPEVRKEPEESDEIIEETREIELNSSSEEELFLDKDCDISDDESIQRVHKHIKPSL
jgi:antibiotic biosynthesis monooxygenase (ABM) superfamily enzyme